MTVRTEGYQPKKKEKQEMPEPPSGGSNVMTAPTQAQIEALIKALEPFAKIEIPPNADDGTWVAKTLFCNNQITAFQVRQARAACNAKIAFDAAALTAAAEVEDDDPLNAKKYAEAYFDECVRLKAELAATIERCAQELETSRPSEAQKAISSDYNEAVVSTLEWAAAKIRALKEKP